MPWSHDKEQSCQRSAPTPTDPAGVVRIRLIIGDDVATATLEPLD